MMSQVARQTVLEGEGDHVGVGYAVVVMAGNITNDCLVTVWEGSLCDIYDIPVKGSSIA